MFIILFSLLCIASAEATTYYWVAGSNSTWNNSANWDTTQGGPGGDGVPTASGDTAIFDSGVSSACTIDTALSITAITNTNYTGTLDADTYNVTLTGNLQYDSGILDLGSGTWSVSGNWDTSSVGTLVAGTSLVYFPGGNSKAWTPGSGAYNNVQLNKAGGAGLTVSGTADIDGTLTVTDGWLEDESATLTVAGNLVVGASADGDFSGKGAVISLNGTGIQTITSSGGSTPSLTINSSGTVVLDGNLNVDGNLTVTAGTFTPGSYTVAFRGESSSTWTPGSEIYQDVEINRVGGCTLNVVGTADIDGTLTLTDGMLEANGTGTLTVAGNLVVGSSADGAYTGHGATIILNGAGTQTITSSGGYVPSLTINSSGAVVIDGDLNVEGNFTFTAGTFVQGASEIVFADYDTPNATWTPGSATYQDIGINCPWGGVTVSGTADIDGTLTLTNGRFNSGTLTVAGNVTYVSTYDVGSTAITLDGTGTQTVALSGTTTQTSLLTINKSSGTAVITGTGKLYDISVLDGTLDFDGGYTYTINTGDTWTVASGAGINMTGAVDSVATLTAAGTWILSVNAAADYLADYVDVTYSNASSGRKIYASNSTNSGNNTNWEFVTAGDRYWVASGAGTWSDNDNWSTSSAGAGGCPYPQTGDTAIFDDQGTGACTVDTTVSVAAITNTNYAGTLDADTYDVTISGDFQYDGNTSVLDLGSGTWTVSGNWDTDGLGVEFTEGTSTVVMTGSNKTMNIKSGQDFYNLTIDTGASVTFSNSWIGLSIQHRLDVDGTFTISTSNGNYITVDNADTVLDFGANGVLNQNGADSYIAFYPVSSGTQPTITGTGTLSAKTIFYIYYSRNIPARTYNNDLTITESWGGGNRTGTLDAGTFTINGNFYVRATQVSNATVDAATNNPNVDISGLIDFTGPGAGTEIIQAGSGTWNVAGNIDFTAGTLTGGTYNTSTFILDGTGTQTVTSAGESFNNLQTAGSGTVLLADDLSVGGNFTTTAGTTAFDAQSANVTVTGDFQYDVGSLDLGSGTWTIGGYWDTDGLEAEFEDGTSTIVLTGASKTLYFRNNQNFYNLTVSGSCTTDNNRLAQMRGGTLKVSGTLTLGNYSTLDFSYAGGATDLLGGTINGGTGSRIDVSNEANMLDANGTINVLVNALAQSGNTTLPGRTYGGGLTFRKTWGNLTTKVILGSGIGQTVTVTGDLNVDNDDDYALVADAATNDPTVNVSGNVLIHADNVTSGDATLQMGDGAWDVGGYIDFTGAGAGTEIIEANAATVNVAGNIDLTGGTLTAGSSVFILDGGSAQTITSDGESFATLTIENSSATVTFADALSTGTLTASTVATKLAFATTGTHTVSTAVSMSGGTGSSMIVLAPATASTTWNFSPPTGKTVTGVNVSYSNSDTEITANSSNNGGNNVNWTFGGVTRYWIADSAGTWNTTANWSDTSNGTGGLSIPTTGDTAIFDSNGTGACTVDTTVSIAAITNTNYAGTLDAGTYNVTLSGDFQYDSGVLNLNAGTWTIAGNWDTSSVGTFTYGTATVNLTGTDKTLVVGAWPKSVFPNLTISGAISTGDSLEILTGIVVSGTLTLTGTVSQKIVLYTATSNFTGGIITAAGVQRLVADGSTLDTNGTLNCNVMFGNRNNTTMPARNYGKDVTIYAATGWTLTITPAAGTHNISGNFYLQDDSAQNLTFDGSANDPTMNIDGNIAFTGSGAGGEVLSAGDGTWNVAGNITFDSVNDSDTAGTLTAANSVFVLDGGSAQTITSNAESFATLTIENASATVTFADAMSTGTFTASTAATKLAFATSGTHTVSTAVSMSGGTGSNMIVLAPATASTTWNFSPPASTTVTGVNVSYSTSDKTITANSSNNGGNNINWNFGAVNRYWIADSAGTWNTTANWSDTSNGTGGLSIPTTGDTAIFDSNGTGACTVDTTVSIAAITNTNYAGTLDADTYNVTISGDFQYDGNTSVLDLGSGTWTISGNWDTDGLGAEFTEGTSTVVLDGAGKNIYVKTGQDFYNLNINTASAITLNNGIQIQGGTVTVSSGTLNLSAYLGLLANANSSISGVIAGSADVQVWSGTLDSGGTITCDVLYRENQTVTARDYGGTITCKSTSASNVTNTVGSGSLNISGNLILQEQNVGNLTFDCNSNPVDVDIGGDIDFTGTGDGFEIIDAGGGTWNVAGDINFKTTDDGGGTLTARTSVFILDGTSAQTVTSNTNSFNALTIENASATVTFADNATCTNFNAQTASSIVVFPASGTFTATNLTLNGVATGTRVKLRSSTPTTAWNLVSSGTQSVSNTDVQDSNASGGDKIDASDGTNLDSLRNTNWNFPATSITAFTDSSGTDVATYDPGALIYVKVTDADENKDSSSAETITVTVTSLTPASDSETLTLTEDAVDSGVFINSTGLTFSVLSGSADADDLTLEVDPSDNTITASYTDANDATDTSSDTATTTLETNVSGSVGDAKSLAALKQITVTMYDTDGTTTIGSGTTNASGAYAFTVNVSSGTYTVSFTGSNLYKPKTVSVYLTAGTDLDIGTTLIDPYGIVYDSVTLTPIAGARVTLHNPDGTISEKTPQQNPQSTGADGYFSFYAPSGKYYLSAEAINYSFFRSVIFSVVDTAVEYNIPMEPLTIDAQPSLSINKVANKTQVQSGDIITYTVTVGNVSTSTITGLQVVDNLPYNFRYIKDSTTIDGVKSADPAGLTQQRLVWTLSNNLTTGSSAKIKYRTNVGIDAKLGKNTNRATTSGFKSGASVSAGPSIVNVYVRESIFSSRGIIIGKVFLDYNNNGIQEENLGEEGIPDVEIITETGLSVITDGYGRFHFENVEAGKHTIYPNLGSYLDKKVHTNLTQIIDVPATGTAKADFGIMPTERLKEKIIFQRYLQDIKTALDNEKKTKDVGKKEKYLKQAMENLKKIQALKQKSAIDTAERKELVAELIQKRENIERLYEQAHALYRKKDYEQSKEKLEEVAGLVNDYVYSPIIQARIEETEPAQFILVGLADGQIGKLKVDGSEGNLKTADNKSFEDGIYEEGSIKFFLKGKVKGKYLLTARLDTEKNAQDKIYEYINPDKYYSIYGDDSKPLNQAPSAGKVFFLLEWPSTTDLAGGTNYLTWGPWTTGEFTETKFTGYYRTLTGAKVSLATDIAKTPLGEAVDGFSKSPAMAITGFFAKLNQQQKKEQIKAQGISGPYYLTQQDILEYTEKVQLEIRSKQRTSLILKTIEKKRDIDYTMDYDNGSITFNGPVASWDSQGNLVYIVVNYEYTPSGTGREDTVRGIRTKTQVGDLTLGSSFVEKQDATNWKMLGVDAELDLAKDTKIKAELGRTDSTTKRAGSSYRFELQSVPTQRISLAAIYEELSKTFDNPENLIEEKGLRRYALSSRYKMADWAYLILGHWEEKSYLASTIDRSYGAEVESELSKRLYSGLGYEYKQFIDKKDAMQDYNSNIAKAMLGYRLTDKLSAELEQEYESKNGQNFTTVTDDVIRTTTARAQYKIDDNKSIYGRYQYRQSKKENLIQTQAALGIETEIIKDAKTFLEYSIENQTQSLKGSYNQEVKIADDMKAKIDISAVAKEKDENDAQAKKGAPEIITTQSVSLERDLGEGAKETYKLARTDDAASLELRKQLSEANAAYLRQEFGDENKETVGVEHMIPVSEDLTATFNLERSTTRGASRTSTNAQSVAFKYSPYDDYQANLKLERENASAHRQTNILFEQIGKLTKEFAVANKADVKLRTGKSENTNLINDQEYTASIAYRPIYQDRLNLLGKYSYQRYQDNQSEATKEDQAIYTGSVEALLEVTPKIDLFAKYSVRSIKESAEDITSRSQQDLVTARVIYKFLPSWDVFTEYRVLSDRETKDKKQEIGLEAGYELAENLRLAAGYKFLDYDDHTRDADSYTADGPYVRLSASLYEAAQKLLMDKEEKQAVFLGMQSQRYSEIFKLSPLQRFKEEINFYYEQGKYWFSAGDYIQSMGSLQAGLLAARRVRIMYKDLILQTKSERLTQIETLNPVEKPKEILMMHLEVGTAFYDSGNYAEAVEELVNALLLAEELKKELKKTRQKDKALLENLNKSCDKMQKLIKEGRYQRIIEEGKIAQNLLKKLSE